MASSTTSPTTYTNTTAVRSSLLALTTPFIPPDPSCANIVATTTTVTSDWRNNFTTSILTVVYSDPSNPRFTQCQPQGWDQVVPKSRFHFSPAVCPDQWTAYGLREVGVDIQTPSLSRSATTAYCCASGHTLGNPRASLTLKSIDEELACVSAIGINAEATTSSTHSAGQTPRPEFPNGIHIHNAYQISWGATDKPTLSPTPPDFSPGCGATLGTWVPGEPVETVVPCHIQPYDGGGAKTAAAMVFVMVGIPVIVAVLICSCCGYYIRKSRRKQRALRQAMRDVDTDGAGRELVDSPGGGGGDVKT